MQPIRLDADASKGISEEVAKAFAVSLNHIDTYRYDGGIKLLLGQTTDYGDGGVTESLANEIKMVVRISFLYHIVNCCLHANKRHCRKVCNTNNIPTVCNMDSGN